MQEPVAVCFHDGSTAAQASPDRGTAGMSPAGFTLIEVIVALVVAAILGTILVTFMTGTVTRSVQPVLQAQQGSYLNSVVEAMTAEFNLLSAARGEDVLGALKHAITHNDFGDEHHPYVVVHNDYVVLNDDAGEHGRHLLVVVQYQNITLSTLFSE